MFAEREMLQGLVMEAGCQCRVLGWGGGAGWQGRVAGQVVEDHGIVEWSRSQFGSWLYHLSGV